MKPIGIFYGSTTGSTEQVAHAIAKELNVDEKDIHDVTSVAPSAVGEYHVVLLGASTWGDGDEQDDMHDFMDGVSQLDLKGRYVGLFGCGDETMSETFCNAVGKMYYQILPTEATIVGRFNAAGYDFAKSEALDGDQTVGLLIDNVNHPELSGAKIKEWCQLIKEEVK